MPCSNHPEVLDGLDTCTRCGKTFCIDCLVGRKAGWFCAPCDAAAGGAAAAGPPASLVAAPPPPPSVLPPRRACANQPEVVEKLNPCSRCRKNFCPDCLVELKSGRYCAGCKTEALKDLQSGVDQSQLPLAHLGRRFLAWFIDMFVIVGLSMPIIIILVVVQGGIAKPPDPGDMGGLGVQLIFNVIGSLIPLVYKAVMLQKKGQTVGKMAMGIKVVNPDGSEIGTSQAWMRSFIELLLSCCCYISYIVAFFNKDKCTLHDMAARTRVIRVS
jgi:uncharacterized RDD family membrane protein YckC